MCLLFKKETERQTRSNDSLKGQQHLSLVVEESDAQKSKELSQLPLLSWKEVRIPVQMGLKWQ